MTTQTEFLQSIGPTSTENETSESVVPTTLSESMSSAAGFPVRIFPTLGKGQGLTASGQDCSSKPFAWFANSDRESLSWKTWQRCLLGDWTEFSGRWPRSGLMRNGIAYRLPPLVPRISGTESLSSGFVPTPSAQEPGINHERIVDKHGNVPEHPNQRLYDKHTGRLVQDGLSQFVKMWPTPTGKTSPNTKDPKDPDDIVNSDMEPLQPGQKPYDRRTGKPVTTALADMVRKMWGTPNAHPRTFSPRDVDHGVQLANQVGGSLNPTWVEWLMGFPLGWTDCEDLETP